MKQPQIFRLLFSCALLMSLASVPAFAQKSSKHQGPIARVYHNTVARYNGYYNANNKMKAAMKDVSSSLQDDYDNVLPLDKSELATSAAIPDIDSIIMRLTVVNKLHPQSKWVDDDLLLIGKAYYLKKDYESALQTFQYIVGSEKPRKTDAKKKQEGKKLEYDGVNVPWLKPHTKHDIFHNEPARDEALLWLVKTYVKQKRYDDAQTVIELLEKDYSYNFKYRAELEAINAQMHINQKEYDKAIKPVIYAIAMTDNKKLKTRYAYVLGQLYQLTAQNEKAIKAYETVLKLKPDYKMQFYANTNLARACAAAGKGNNDVLEMLQKLGRNEKYEEFRGKIYYTIAEIYRSQHNDDEAVNYYVKTIRANSPGKEKSLAYLHLGEMNYNLKAYPVAKNYYDSTMATLDKDYVDYGGVQKRDQALTNLVTETGIIHAQDSLQKLGNMSDKDRARAVSASLANWEHIQQEKEAAAQAQNTGGNPNSANASGQTAGSFYFYNAALKATGYTEFTAKYGNRNNEDNWRRANKRSDNTALNNPDANGPGNPTAATGNVTYDALMAGIPTTPDQMQASDKKLAEAYYRLGNVYKNDFNDSRLALQTFEALETRLPGNAFEPQAYYQMYLLYGAAHDDAQANTYKNLLLTKYPNDPTAKYLTNPDAAIAKPNAPVQNYYDYTYNLYQSRQYPQAMRAADSARIKFPNNALSPKFDLIRAYAVGQTQPKDSFKVALTNFTKHYTSGPEQARAKELLAMLSQTPAGTGQKDVKKPESISNVGDFALHPNNPQYVMIIFDAIQPTNKSVSDSITAINAKYHGSENLKVTTMLLDETRQMILVKQLKNMPTAMTYYNDLQAREKLFDKTQTTHHIFVIDDKNFTNFFKSKNVEQYSAFFEQNYH